MSWAKAAEPIKMQFGPWAQWATRNRVLGERPDPPHGKEHFSFGGQFGMPRLAGGRYSQRYSLVAEVVRPLAPVNCSNLFCRALSQCCVILGKPFYIVACLLILLTSCIR